MMMDIDDKSQLINKLKLSVKGIYIYIYNIVKISILVFNCLS